jgi:hypothetical protein
LFFTVYVAHALYSPGRKAAVLLLWLLVVYSGVFSGLTPVIIFMAI